MNICNAKILVYNLLYIYANRAWPRLLDMIILNAIHYSVLFQRIMFDEPAPGLTLESGLIHGYAKYLFVDVSRFNLCGSYLADIVK